MKTITIIFIIIVVILLSIFGYYATKNTYSERFQGMSTPTGNEFMMPPTNPCQNLNSNQCESTDVCRLVQATHPSQNNEDIEVCIPNITQCSSGYQNVYEDGEYTCKKCPAGEYSSDGLQCKPCDARSSSLNYRGSGTPDTMMADTPAAMSDPPGSAIMSGGPNSNPLEASDVKYSLEGASSCSTKSVCSDTEYIDQAINPSLVDLLFPESDTPINPPRNREPILNDASSITDDRSPSLINGSPPPGLWTNYIDRLTTHDNDVINDENYREMITKDYVASKTHTQDRVCRTLSVCDRTHWVTNLGNNYLDLKEPRDMGEDTVLPDPNNPNNPAESTEPSRAVSRHYYNNYDCQPLTQCTRASQYIGNYDEMLNSEVNMNVQDRDCVDLTQCHEYASEINYPMRDGYYVKDRCCLDISKKLISQGLDPDTNTLVL